MEGLPYPFGAPSGGTGSGLSSRTFSLDSQCRLCARVIYPLFQKPPSPTSLSAPEPPLISSDGPAVDAAIEIRTDMQRSKCARMPDYARNAGYS